MLFLKPPSSLIGHGEAIVYPSTPPGWSTKASWRWSSAARHRRVTPEEAAKAVLGWTCANDVTERDMQAEDKQWWRAKGYDTFAVAGPFLETETAAARGLDPYPGQRPGAPGGAGPRHDPRPVRRSSRCVSQAMTLERGDLIMLGTPPGVGELQPGDEVEVEIDGVGYLRNPVELERGERGAGRPRSAGSGCNRRWDQDVALRRRSAPGGLVGAGSGGRARSAASPGGRLFPRDLPLPLAVETEAGTRSLVTSILYLLTAIEPSRFHRLRSDELWFYHAGAPAELVLLGNGAPEFHKVCLSSPQVTIPGNRWMAARVMPEEQADWGAGRAPERRWTPDRRAARELRWTLVSCVVTPGFEYDDFEMGEREALLREFPRAKNAILALT